MTSHIYRNPNKYSKNNALQYDFAMKLLSKIPLTSQSRVLDIGCGDGLITNKIATIVSDGCIIGTDISEQMIAFASEKYKNQSNLGFLTMDASKNIFREQFDIITSFNCLHWVKDQQAAINGIARAALPGSNIVLLLSHKKSTYHLVLDNLCSSNTWKEYFIDFNSPRSFFEADDYKKIIINSGLQLLTLQEEEMIYSFQSKEQLKDFFNTAGSQIKCIPDDRKNEFLNDFINDYLKMTNLTNDNLIPISFWCLQIIASKPTVQNQT